MTMILNTATPSAASAPAQAAQQAGPVAAAQDAAPAGTSAASAAAGTAAPAANAANAAAPAAAANGTTNPAPAQAFAQWLGQQLDGAAQAAPAATLPAAPAQADTGASVTALAVTPVGGKTGTAAGTAAASDSDDGSKTAAAPDTGAMLAAMAMPLMPLSPQQITVALQAAAGSAPARADDGAARTAAAPVAASGDAGQRAALALPQLAALQQPVQAQAQVQVPAPGAAAADATATRLAVQAANDGSVAANSGNSAGNSAGSNGGGNAGDGGADMAAVQTAPLANAAPVAAGAPVAASVQPAADTVKLAGPPTAWRQSLQEALGERLHVQVGNNIQQATISIEPPQLGRIDIAIRHSAGTLEVNISATNGDVLRQLQTVSDNLRSDLSQRQYTEVAVTVTPAPKNNAAPFGDPQQQGRGRQQERNQDNDPGRALAEAGTPASRFSLGGRES